ncbi:MAG: hypothetical protein U5K00_16475 [Melioribacteraceae bacterium]|nr:hypothetical protein [Melioribacteraceae bacterium]
MNLKGKHFLTCDDWTKEELDVVFKRSFELKKEFYEEKPHLYLPHKTLFMIFFEQSTRTRNSMEAGMTQLGGHAHDLTADKMQLITRRIRKRYSNNFITHGTRNCIAKLFLRNRR